MFVRYVLNYLPFGAVYRVCTLLPSKLLIVSLRELYRAQQIHSGFLYASNKFQHSTLAIAVYSVVVGMQLNCISARPFYRPHFGASIGVNLDN